MYRVPFRIIILIAIFVFPMIVKAKTIIVIAGGTASGKTTISNELKKCLGDKAIVISQDSYYKDLSHLLPEARKSTNFDHPDSIEFSLLKEHLLKLKANKSIRVPIYNFTQHTRLEKSNLMRPAEIIIVEGILLLNNSEIRKLADVKVFIDVSDDVRVLRRVNRDMLERGREFSDIQNQYLRTVKPMHDQFVKPSKKFADILITSGADNAAAIKILSLLAK